MDLYEKGEQLYLAGNFEKAKKCFQIICKNKTDNSALNYLACCDIQLGYLDEAKKILDDLIKRTEWERPLFNLGRVYLIQNNFTDAKKCFEQAVLKNPNNGDCYFYLGLYYYKTGNLAKAIGAYQKALCLVAQDAETHLNLAVCYYKERQYPLALRHFKEAFQLDPFMLEAKYYQAKCLIKLKNYRKACRILLDLKKQGEGIENIDADIAYCLARLKA